MLIFPKAKLPLRTNGRLFYGPIYRKTYLRRVDCKYSRRAD